MTGSTINTLFLTLAFALLAFALAFIVVSAVMQNKIAAEKRLDELKKSEGDGSDLALVKHESKRQKRERERKSQSKFFEKLGNQLYTELQSANITMRPEEFAIIWILVAFVPGGLVAMFTTNITIAAVLVGVGCVGPVVLIKQKQKKRVKLFEEQLSDALLMCCSSLKSGLSFNQAMEAIATDMADPISTEFAITLREINMGFSMDEALDNMGKRIKSKQLDLMVSAILIQRQTGGNLSRILENISDTIKERMKLKKQLKTTVAGGKSSGKLVAAMPWILIGLFSIFNWDMEKILFTETRGRILLLIAAGLEVMAFVSINKICSVKM